MPLGPIFLVIGPCSHRFAHMTLTTEIESCKICAVRFAATHTAHAPRPIVWFRPSARIWIAGRAPGL
jgi:uracil-DNA glycosylase